MGKGYIHGDGAWNAAPRTWTGATVQVAVQVAMQASMVEK